jgi:flavin-dependent dehydrogenase
VEIPAETDIVVAGGGPVGLAAALAARREGLAVLVADRAEPPIDKACGEGLMPDGVAALRRLGVDLGDRGIAFRGVRFLEGTIEGGIAAEACFPERCGVGIRRTQLHRVLVEHALAAGVVACWRARVEGGPRAGVTVGGRAVRCRWVVGADGFHSHIRQWAGLGAASHGLRRIGVRRHFRIRPWSEFVEVYWRRNCQAYVTPVAPDEVCVALVGSGSPPRFVDLSVAFPRLARRIADAAPIGRERGAISMTSRLAAVTRGHTALVGDASGSIDAVTGEGLAVAFRQAAALGEALAAGDLSAYEADHRRIGRAPRMMSRLLLLMDRSNGLRRRALLALAARPRTFSRLMAFHIGELRPSQISLDACGLALGLIAPHIAP